MQNAFAERGPRIMSAEKITDREVFRFSSLMKKRDGSLATDDARRWFQMARDNLRQSGFADAIGADESHAARIERNVHIFEQDTHRSAAAPIRHESL